MQRLECLDGLRGALAVYVMASHMAPFAVLPWWLASALSHGGAGVDLFFILSGMVIIRSLESCAWQARPFLIARIFRIFPVYLAMLGLAAAVQPLPTPFAAMPWVGPGSSAHVIWSDGWPRAWVIDLAAHLSMTHGLFTAGVLPDVWVSFLGAAWSLSTEWQFYVLALIAGRVATGWRLVLLFLLLACAGLVWSLSVPADWQFSRAFLPNKAQYFALGIASAILVRDGARRGYLVTLAATLVLCDVQGGLEKTLPPVVWGLCLAAQMQANLPGAGALARLLRARTAVWLGGVSYGAYLANEPIQKVLGIWLAVLAQGDARLFTALWMPLAMALPVLMAVALHRYVEVPALRLGRALAASQIRRANVQYRGRRPA
jgi:peptidoglycan/LPS O-acetylase OafA/YrhL